MSTNLPEAPLLLADKPEMHEWLMQWHHSWIGTKEYLELPPAEMQRRVALLQWLHQCIACVEAVKPQ